MRRMRYGLGMLLLALLAAPALAGEAQMPDISPDAPGTDDTFFAFADSQEASAPAEQTGGAPEEAGPQERPWTYPVPRDLLDDPLDLIRLVNRDCLLETDYPPEDVPLYTLVDATVKKSKGGEMLVREVALEALERMFAAAEADGMQLRLHSAYRSYRTQAVMHENRVNRIGRDDGVVQLPGASDHQTGLGFDIINPAWAQKDRFTTAFAGEDEAKWMAENGPRFGFIIRYPEGKTEITGIMFEPWHLRYVGPEVATYMTDSGLTLEEFTAEWRAALAEWAAGPAAEAVVDSFSF